MMNRFFASIFFFSVILNASYYQDEIRVEGAKFRPLNLAMPNFKLHTPSTDLSKFSDGLWRRLNTQLNDSGVFKILDRKGYLKSGSEAGVSKDEIKFVNWRNIGAEGLIRIRLDQKNQETLVDVFAYKLASTNQYFNKQYSVRSTQLKQLSNGIADDIFEYFTGEPGAFSTKLAAVKLVKGQKQLVLMDMDGEHEKQLTKSKSPSLLPTFSLDGRKLFFTSYERKNPDLYNIDLKSGAVKLFSGKKGLNVGGNTSPDGKSIAVTLSRDGNSEIYLLHPNGKIKQRLTFSWGIDTSPNFSPDGKQLAFVSARSGEPHIYVMNVDGSDQRRLTFRGTYNQTPRYSPDGKKIAFTARDETNTYDIFLVDVKSGQISRVTQNQGSNEEPSFSPNGRFLVFTSTRSSGRDIYLTNLDGSFQKRVTSGGKYWTPVWGPYAK